MSSLITAAKTFEQDEKELIIPILDECLKFTEPMCFSQHVHGVSPLAKAQIVTLKVIDSRVQKEYAELQLDVNALGQIEGMLNEILGDLVPSKMPQELISILKPLVKRMIWAIASYQILGVQGLKHVTAAVALDFQTAVKNHSLNDGPSAAATSRFGQALKRAFQILRLSKEGLELIEAGQTVMERLGIDPTTVGQ